MKMQPLRESCASLIGTDLKGQADKVAALNRDQLATLLEGVDTYLRTTMTTLAAKGLTAPGKGFEIKMVLDPLVFPRSRALRKRRRTRRGLACSS